VDVHELLRRYDIHPSKGLGQHLLVADWAYERILTASELTGDDVILEIGPGLGTLTARLAETARHVVAVELDPRMVAVLADTLGNRPNVTIRQADILELSLKELMAEHLAEAPRGAFKVVANLPYYITSRVLRHLLGTPVRPALMTLMVQKEVADRIIAAPGEMSLLAVSVQVYAQATRVCTIPSSAFYPRPQVSSAILSLRSRPEPVIPDAEAEAFFTVVRAGFGQRRKQLRNSLASGLQRDPNRIAEALISAGIDPRARAQALDLDGWVRLTRALSPLPE